MPSDRAELARLAIEHWDDPEVLESWAHPEIEFEVVTPGGGVGRGIEAMTQTFAQFLKAWDDFHADVDEVIELEGDRVLALTRFSGRGKESGLPLEGMRGEALFAFRDDRVVKLTLFGDRDAAFAAAGLSGDDPRRGPSA